MAYFSQFGQLQNFRRVYNRDRRESGYAFFDVEAFRAAVIVDRPHLVKHALINCKVAADSDQISQVQKNEMERKIYVSNLPPGTSDLDLFQLFEVFGKLSKAYLVRNRQDGTCKNFGFVIFQRQQDVEALLKAPPCVKFRHRKVTIKQAVDRQTQKQLKQAAPRVLLASEPTPHNGEGSSKRQMLFAARERPEDEANYKFHYARRRATAPVHRAGVPGAIHLSQTSLTRPSRGGTRLHN